MSGARRVPPPTRPAGPRRSAETSLALAGLCALAAGGVGATIAAPLGVWWAVNGALGGLVGAFLEKGAVGLWGMAGGLTALLALTSGGSPLMAGAVVLVTLWPLLLAAVIARLLSHTRERPARSHRRASQARVPKGGARA